MIAWVRQQPDIELDNEAMEAAAAEGHTAVCEYLRAEQCPWGTSACDAAAFNGHTDTLRWLHEHGCPWEAETVRESAASHSTVEVMVYLQQHDLLSTPAVLTRMLNTAGTYNTLAAAQWLRQQGAEWPAVLNYCDLAWSGETLAWARAEGCTSPTEEPHAGMLIHYHHHIYIIYFLLYILFQACVERDSKVV